MNRLIVGLTALALLLGWAGQASAGAFAVYLNGEDAIIPSGIPGEGDVLRATSDVSVGHPGYGGMKYNVTSPALTFNSLTQLSALYQMTTGAFGGGAPRFGLADASGNQLWIYWGTPTGGGSFADSHPGTYASTGNLVDPLSTDVRYYSNGFGGLNTPNTGDTYAQIAALIGNTALSAIYLDLDGGFTGTQVMITDEFTVGTSTTSETYEAGPDASAAPEPATLTLLGIGIAGMAGYGWRRRKQAAA